MDQVVPDKSMPTDLPVHVEESAPRPPSFTIPPWATLLPYLSLFVAMYALYYNIGKDNKDENAKQMAVFTAFQSSQAVTNAVTNQRLAGIETGLQAVSAEVISQGKTSAGFQKSIDTLNYALHHARDTKPYSP